MLTCAICTYNRAGLLSELLGKLEVQSLDAPWRILVVDNNSTDDTPRVVAQFARQGRIPVVHVRESRQGISHARNRAVEESLGSDQLVFIDDDESPAPQFLSAALKALDHDGADCVGGPIHVDFRGLSRPGWLDESLCGFLGALDYGDEPFWVRDSSTPLYSGNIAYRVAPFRNDPTLRFDVRYNRVGHTLGGGEDVRMFETLLERGMRIRYTPAMSIWHHVPADRLRRSYFLRIHHIAGMRRGRYAMAEYDSHAFGMPPFLVRQALAQGWKSLRAWASGAPDSVRTAMNFTYALGVLRGRWQARGDRRTA